MKVNNQNLPITHDTCPGCGSTTDLGEETIKQLKVEHKIDKDSFKNGLVMPFPLYDPARPPKLIIGNSMKVSVIMVSLVFCECGEIYFKKFDVIEQQMPVQMMGMSKS